LSTDLRCLGEASPEARALLDTVGAALVDAEELTRRLDEALGQRQAAIAQLSALLDAMAASLDDAFVVIDHRLAVCVATRAARRLLGLDTVGARPTLDAVLPDDVVHTLRRALGFALVDAGPGSGPVTARTADLELTAHRATSAARIRAPRGPVRWKPTAPEHVAAYAVIEITEIPGGSR
jgi:PAS domain-containing protein